MKEPLSQQAADLVSALSNVLAQSGAKDRKALRQARLDFEQLLARTTTVDQGQAARLVLEHTSTRRVLEFFYGAAGSVDAVRRAWPQADQAAAYQAPEENQNQDSLQLRLVA